MTPAIMLRCRFGFDFDIHSQLVNTFRDYLGHFNMRHVWDFTMK